MLPPYNAPKTLKMPAGRVYLYPGGKYNFTGGNELSIVICFKVSHKLKAGLSFLMGLIILTLK